MFEYNSIGCGEIAFKTLRCFRAKNIQYFNYLFIVARNSPYHFTPVLKRATMLSLLRSYYFLKAISPLLGG